MARQIADQQKISLLIGAVLIFIFVSTIGFGAAIVYNMVRLQSGIQEAYQHPLSKTGFDMHATLSRLHNDMLQLVLLNDPTTRQRMNAEVLVLDGNIRNDLLVVKAELPGETEKIAGIERLLDEWRSMRAQLISLVGQGSRDQAFKLAAGGVQIYSQLDTKVSDIVASAQHHTTHLIEEAKIRISNIIGIVWWFLGGLVISGISLGLVVIRKVGTILTREKYIVRKLYESEERMKLALSGADEGTWDLDIETGLLNFDAQWGEILGFFSEKDRPHCFNEWAVLIHADDRARVLKAMQDHVEGRVSEYKAEYRIRSSSGTLRWVMGHGRAVSRDADGKALRIVGVTRDITLKKQAEDRIWQLAHSDLLTGLPNRVLFYDRLGQSIAQASRHHRKLALLFLDLDGFKKINDKYGHDAGDDLLQEAAERLRQNIRAGDTVARIGGDEFIFILNDVSGAVDAVFVAQKIIHSLGEPFVINGNVCQIGGSIGISIFPDDSEKIETLITQSDNAMYKAKKMGKNNYQFFNEHLHIPYNAISM